MEKEVAKYKQYLQQHYPESSTAKHYVSDLGIFKRFVGEKSPREITLKMIDAFVQEQSNQQLKPRTINRRLAAISSFFEHLINEVEDDKIGVIQSTGKGTLFEWASTYRMMPVSRRLKPYLE